MQPGPVKQTTSRATRLPSPHTVLAVILTSLPNTQATPSLKFSFSSLVSFKDLLPHHQNIHAPQAPRQKSPYQYENTFSFLTADPSGNLQPRQGLSAGEGWLAVHI